MKKTFFKLFLSAALFLLSGNALLFANAIKSADLNTVIKETSQSTFNEFQERQDYLIINSVPFNSENKQASIVALEFEVEEESLVAACTTQLSIDTSFEFEPFFSPSKIKYYTAPSRYNLTSCKYLLYQVFLI